MAQAFVDGSTPVPVVERDTRGLPAAFVVGAVLFAILLSIAVTLALLASLQPS